MMQEEDASIILKLLQVLNFIHSWFHVHLNLKLSNVFIGESNEIKLVDLGVPSLMKKQSSKTF